MKKGATYARLKLLRNQRNELIDILVRLTMEGSTLTIEDARVELARVQERVKGDR